MTKLRTGASLTLFLAVGGLLVVILAITIPLILALSLPFGEIAKATGTGGTSCLDLPEPYKALFVRAGSQFSVQPALIAGIFVGEHQSIEENGYAKWPDAATNWDTSTAGAQGPFQFLPSTWAGYQQDGNGDGKKDIQSLDDSAFGAAAYLANLGAGSNTTDEQKIRDAASRYNSGKPWKQGEGIKETNKYVNRLVWPTFQHYYCDPTTTVAAIRNTTGNDNVPLFQQGDPRWGSHPYGSSTIKASGCCTTSAAMVLASYGFSVDPVTISDYSASRGYYIAGEGTNHAGLFPELAKKYGLQFQNLGSNWDKALTLLASHHPLIVRGDGAAPFTSGGHCIVITGYDPSTSMIRVNNPAGGASQFPLSHLKAQHGIIIYYIGK